MCTMSDPMARWEAVHKAYGNVRALQGLNLELQRGEVLALLGPNGAGKTTAVSLLLGLLRPDAGCVTVWQRDPRDPEVRARVGAMLQETGVAHHLTVEELLDLYRAYYPQPESMATLLAAGDLEALRRRRVHALSGGQRQRLHFALALAGQPDLLCLDEPSAGLDLESRHRMWAVVRQLAKDGCSVLLTTHHLEEADALADRVVVLDRGRILAEGTPAELQARVSGRLLSCVTTLNEATLEALPGVRRISRRGAQVDIITSQAEALARRLLDLDPDLRELQVRGVGLEQAFLTLTESSETATETQDREERAA